jgi:hypothetical protein
MKPKKTVESPPKGRRMDISNNPSKGTITIKFDGPVTFLSFLPEDARRVAEDLVNNAKEIERKRTQ